MPEIYLKKKYIRTYEKRHFGLAAVYTCSAKSQQKRLLKRDVKHNPHTYHVVSEDEHNVWRL